MAPHSLGNPLQDTIHWPSRSMPPNGLPLNSLGQPQSSQPTDLFQRLDHPTRSVPLSADGFRLQAPSQTRSFSSLIPPVVIPTTNSLHRDSIPLNAHQALLASSLLLKTSSSQIKSHLSFSDSDTDATTIDPSFLPSSEPSTFVTSPPLVIGETATEIPTPPIEPAPSTPRPTSKKKKRPHECQYTDCDRSFLYADKLAAHVRTHTGERPFGCEFCGNSFVEKGTLKRHIRTHTGERPYGCDVCGKRFTLSFSLTDHMITHGSRRMRKRRPTAK